jgi:predicted transglutaminase-like cysteine proteinase
MRALLFGLALLLAPAPVASDPEPSAPVAQSAPIKIPVDRKARHKFPHDNPRLVDALAFVNLIVNAAIQPVSDLDHYGVPDLWVMMPPDGAGDCEDYVLTKYMLISNFDGQPINPVTRMRIAGVMVGPEGHAILAIRLPSGAVMYLDNMNSEVMTRRELKAQGYRFSDWVA